MFFDQDILFGKGALALVWMTGNGEFATKKGRRSREYQLILQSDLKKICNHLTTLLPAMGTAHGLSLKKMGTLIKGMGIMYSIKVDNLARDLFQITISLKRPQLQHNPLIDMPARAAPSKKSKKTNEVVPNPDVDRGDDYGALVDIPQNFGSMNVEAELNYDVFGTPRALPHGRPSDFERSSIQPRRVLASPRHPGSPHVPTTSRRHLRNRGEDNAETVYQDLLQRLQTGAGDDARAHCLPEADNLGWQDEQPELDFGDGLQMLKDGDIGFPVRPDADCQIFDDPFVPPLPPDDHRTGTMLPPPPPSSVTSSGIGLPSRLIDSRSMVPETPVGAGTHPENTRKHRNEMREHRNDETFMALDDLDEQSRSRARGRGELRRRLCLQVDERINFSLHDMLHTVNSAVEKKDDWANVQRQLLDKALAPPNSLWKILRFQKDVFGQTGRSCGSSSLNEMIEDIRNKQLRAREVGRLDSTSTVAGMSTANAGQASRSGAGDPEPNLLAQSIDHVENQESNLCALPRIPEEAYGGEDEVFRGAINDYNNEEGVMIADPPDLDRPPEISLQAPEEVRPPPRKRAKLTTANEESRLTKRLDGTKTFQELYPPGQVEKKKAAMAFFALLKMQAKKQVRLHQEEPFGPIAIETLKSK